MAPRTPAPRPKTAVTRLIDAQRAIEAAKAELDEIDLRTLRGEARTLVKNTRVEVNASLANIKKAIPEAVAQTKIVAHGDPHAGAARRHDAG